jgi:hypothetical protein
MHIDLSSDRDLKCDICWENRETLVRRLLEPFERALAVVTAEEAADQYLERRRRKNGNVNVNGGPESGNRLLLLLPSRRQHKIRHLLLLLMLQ